MHFVYVMSEQDKDKMIKLGYALMKEDRRNGVWIFHNKDAKAFDNSNEISKAGIQFSLSNTLTF